jgi:thioredoxin 1
MKRDVIMARCGPCKLIAPAIDEIASEYSPALKVCKLDTDSHPNVAEQCGVYGLPTIALFHNGELVQGAKREGAISKDKIKEWLSEHGIEPAQ